MIAVVVAAGVVVCLQAASYARAVAVGVTAFAVVGFLVGLWFTVQGGSAVDLAYHGVGLAVLVVIATLLLTRSSADR